MKYASRLFSKDEISSVEAAISEVEQRTSAEIVPVVATASGRYDRAEDLFAFLLSMLVLTCIWIWFQGVASPSDSWGGFPSLTIGLPIILLVLVLTFFFGIALATRFPILRLPLISKREMQEEVERRAHETFQRLKISRTENATGVLIYVSLYEHMVHVLGDDTINAKLSEADWQVLCDIVIAGFKRGEPEAGLREGILHSGDFLANHFPIQPGDKNELNNVLHLID